MMVERDEAPLSPEGGSSDGEQRLVSAAAFSDRAHSETFDLATRDSARSIERLNEQDYEPEPRALGGSPAPLALGAGASSVPAIAGTLDGEVGALSVGSATEDIGEATFEGYLDGSSQRAALANIDEIEGYLPAAGEVEGYLAAAQSQAEGFLGPAPSEEQVAPIGDYADDGYGESFGGVADSYVDFAESGATAEGYTDDVGASYADYGSGDSYADSGYDAGSDAGSDYGDSATDGASDSYGVGAGSYGQTYGSAGSIIDDFDDSIPQAISQRDAENIIKRITTKRFAPVEEPVRGAGPRPRAAKRPLLFVIVPIVLTLGFVALATVLGLKPEWLSWEAPPPPVVVKPLTRVITPGERAERLFRRVVFTAECEAFGVKPEEVRRRASGAQAPAAGEDK